MMHPFDAMTEPELKKFFHELSEMIKWKLPKGTGFMLVASPFGAGGVAQYASNVQRGDAIKWMRETIARWETDDFVPRGPEGF